MSAIATGYIYHLSLASNWIVHFPSLIWTVPNSKQGILCGEGDQQVVVGYIKNAVIEHAEVGFPHKLLPVIDANTQELISQTVHRSEIDGGKVARPVTSDISFSTLRNLAEQ